MLAIQKQVVRERVDRVRDTMMGTQAMPKDIAKYIAELQTAVGDKPMAQPPSDAQKFLSKNPKMVKPKPRTAKGKG